MVADPGERPACGIEEADSLRDLRLAQCLPPARDARGVEVAGSVWRSRLSSALNTESIVTPAREQRDM